MGGPLRMTQAYRPVPLGPSSRPFQRDETESALFIRLRVLYSRGRRVRHCVTECAAKIDSIERVARKQPAICRSVGIYVSGDRGCRGALFDGSQVNTFVFGTLRGAALGASFKAN